jgi:hypothetical protein
MIGLFYRLQPSEQEGFCGHVRVSFFVCDKGFRDEFFLAA